MMGDGDHLKGENLSEKRQSAPDEQRLRRYLLGQCSTQESEEVEQAALRDNEVMDLLSVIEDELTEEYVEDELTNADKLFFELSFLDNRERWHKVLLSATFLKRDDILDRLRRHEPPNFREIANLPTEWRSRASERAGFFGVVGSAEEAPLAGERTSEPMEKRKTLWAIPSRTTIWLSAVAIVIAVVSLIYTQPLKRAPVVAQKPVAAQSPVAVQNPVPVITSVTWEKAGYVMHDSPPEGPEIWVTVIGSNFVEDSTVQLNESALVSHLSSKAISGKSSKLTHPHQADFVNKSELRVLILRSELVGLARPQIVVINPAPGGGASPPLDVPIHQLKEHPTGSKGKAPT